MGKSKITTAIAAVLFIAAGIIYCMGVKPDSSAEVFLINQEEKSEMVRVESFDEAIELAEAPIIVNINTAGTDELSLLPGIGEAKAQKIIEYRNEQGSFGTVEDIMLVPGIKEGVFAKIKEFICVEDME